LSRLDRYFWCLQKASVRITLKAMESGESPKTEHVADPMRLTWAIREIEDFTFDNYPTAPEQGRNLSRLEVERLVANTQTVTEAIRSGRLIDGSKLMEELQAAHEDREGYLDRIVQLQRENKATLAAMSESHRAEIEALTIKLGTMSVSRAAYLAAYQTTSRAIEEARDGLNAIAYTDPDGAFAAALLCLNEAADVAPDFAGSKADPITE
jgi:hypothetical protein